MNTLLLFLVVLYLVTLISYTFICDHAKIEVSFIRNHFVSNCKYIVCNIFDAPNSISFYKKYIDKYKKNMDRVV